MTYLSDRVCMSYHKLKILSTFRCICCWSAISHSLIIRREWLISTLPILIAPEGMISWPTSKGRISWSTPYGRIDDEKMSAFHQNSVGIVFVLWLTLLNTSSGFEDEFIQKCIVMDISLYKWSKFAVNSTNFYEISAVLHASLMPFFTPNG